MKIFLRLFFLSCILYSYSSTFSQITNLTVNGSSSHFTMASGDEINWSFNLPVGDMALLEIWIDVNANTVIDPSTDVLWQSFYQADGQEGYDGPPDMDGLANGQIIFGMPVGLAPSEYIMVFSNNGSSVAISGTVSPLASPVFTVSGIITVPSGKSAQYLAVSLEGSGDGGGKFWGAITDAMGNFVVQMDGDTSGNPWRLRIDNTQGLSPAIQEPDKIYLTLDAGIKTLYTGNNFIFMPAAAEVRGIVRDDDGNPIPGADVFINGNMGGLSRNTRTDPTGVYSLGFLSSELPASEVWLGSGNAEDNNMLSAGVRLPTVFSGQVITKDLFVYNVNSSISGTVTLNGNPPNMNLEILANVNDTAITKTWTEFNGNFTINVSSKLYNYWIGPGWLPSGYMYNSVLAHPGQTNVNLNFNLTDVEDDLSVAPDKFELSQNYPNPFNPSTKISWQSPLDGWQTVKVYDMLGKEVATLVDEYKPAGSYKITWNAGNLPSGIYLYQLRAGNFIESKKMSLLK